MRRIIFAMDVGSCGVRRGTELSIYFPVDIRGALFHSVVPDYIIVILFFIFFLKKSIMRIILYINLRYGGA